MHQKLLWLVIVTVLLVGLFAYLFSKKSPIEKSSRPQIVVTFYPYADFVHLIADDKVDIVTLTPLGVDVHDFEPKTGDLAHIHQSDLFVYNGANLEPWVAKVLPDLPKTNPEIINASEGQDLIKEDGNLNPHLWLDPVVVKDILVKITNSLVKIDPQNSAIYLKNLEESQSELDSLHKGYQSLELCPNREVITSHEALSYLARRYQLTITSIQGLSPDEEPSPAKIANLIKQIKTKKIKFILTEGLVDPKYAETIQKEVPGLTLLPFQTVEGLLPDQHERGETYLSLQQDNIKSLLTALQCQP